MQKQQEMLEQQKKMQEQHRMEKELMENERLEQIKNKKDGEQSELSPPDLWPLQNSSQFKDTTIGILLWFPSFSFIRKSHIMKAYNLYVSMYWK